jgi:hypothetical protein
MIYLLPYEKILLEDGLNWIGNYRSDGVFWTRKCIKTNVNYCGIHYIPYEDFYIIAHYEFSSQYKDFEKAKIEMDKYLIELGFVIIPDDKIEEYKILI